MTSAHLSSITNVKKFFFVITNFINNLEQHHMVRLIVMYTSTLHWSFQICSHIHPKSFDAGLTYWHVVTHIIVNGMLIITHIAYIARTLTHFYQNLVCLCYSMLPLDLLSKYRIQHGAIGPLYVTSSYSTWIFCRGVSGFATDCPCGVWCRGLTTCLLHVGPPFGNRLLKNSWAVGFT